MYDIILKWNNNQEEEATMPTVVYIGENLKRVRTRRLLTQEELAERASVSAATVVNVERNQQEPHFRTIRKLAKALDVDPTELLGE
ncbi:MAG: helix-turn-helix domain-containing protein [Actinobacteria bacterium]|nr:helix-turn-helix domain-containing protein [Actinomycetota bacterium]